MMPLHDDRTFLMLQGPHGPFFHQLGDQLRRAGARVLRMGFNRGDEAFWFGAPGFLRNDGPVETLGERLAPLIGREAVTDLVLYGDCRPIHAQAIATAQRLGVTVHIFEEGYLRPYWVTYERGGSNGNSRLMEMSVAQMRTALAMSEIDFPDAPARWGDMREHVFYNFSVVDYITFWQC